MTACAISRANISTADSCCSLVICFQTPLAGLSSSRTIRLSCTLALLSGLLDRFLAQRGKSAQQRIDNAARLQQIGQQSERRFRRRRARIGGLIIGLKIRPRGRDKRSTAVRQDQEQVCAIVSMNPAMHGKRLAFKRVMRTRDDHMRGEILVMGSVLGFPSTPSTMRG